MIKFLRHGNTPKSTKIQIDKVLETWDPDLGDISGITDTDRNNSDSLNETLKELRSTKCDNEPVKKESGNKPPSIFILKMKLKHNSILLFLC